MYNLLNYLLQLFTAYSHKINNNIAVKGCRSDCAVLAVIVARKPLSIFDALVLQPLPATIQLAL